MLLLLLRVKMCNALVASLSFYGVLQPFTAHVYGCASLLVPDQYNSQTMQLATIHESLHQVYIYTEGEKGPVWIKWSDIAQQWWTESYSWSSYNKRS